MSYTIPPSVVKGARSEPERLAAKALESVITADHFLNWMGRHYPEIAQNKRVKKLAAPLYGSGDAPVFAVACAVLRVLRDDNWSDSEKASVLLDLCVCDAGRA